MSTEPGRQPTGRMEPLFTAVTDSVAMGYSALEHVVEGLRESLRLQSGSASAPPARPASTRGGASGSARKPAPNQRRPPASGATVPAGMVQDLAAIVVEALGLAGTLVQDVAQAIGEQTHETGGEACLPTLALTAPAGATATTEFTVWNTGPTLLTNVKLSATELIGGGLPAADTDVAFVPCSIAQIGPGKGATVEVSIAIPADTKPGLCRGIVVASPGDACAVLELTVTAAPPRITVTPIKREAPAEPGRQDVRPS